MKTPAIDLSECTSCEACTTACPHIFRMHGAGYVEVIDQANYDEACVNLAIRTCPAACISWVEV